MFTTYYYSLLIVSVLVACTKSFRLGDRKVTTDQFAQETSTPYVVIPPSTVVQEVDKSDRAFNLRKRRPGTYYSTVTPSYAFSPNDTYPAAKYPNGANSGGRFFGNSILGSEDKDKLQVELAFVLPFLDVPLGSKRSFNGNSMNSMGSGSNNDLSNMETGVGLTSGMNSLLALNPKSIVHAIVLSLAAVVVIPFIISLLTGTTTTSIERSEDSLYRVLAQVDHKLQSYNIDASTCISKAVCTYVRSATKKMIDGRAGSSEQIIDGVAKNTYLKTMVNGTSIAKAIEIGRKPGTNCLAAYPKCPFSANAMSSFVTTFISQMMEKPS